MWENIINIIIIAVVELLTRAMDSIKFMFNISPHTSLLFRYRTHAGTGDRIPTKQSRISRTSHHERGGTRAVGTLDDTAYATGEKIRSGTVLDHGQEWTQDQFVKVSEDRRFSNTNCWTECVRMRGMHVEWNV